MVVDRGKGIAMSSATPATSLAPAGATAVESAVSTPVEDAVRVPTTGGVIENAVRNVGDEKRTENNVTQKDVKPPPLVEPAVPSMISKPKKRTYTFGMYKATKIALGLKKRKNENVDDIKLTLVDAPATTKNDSKKSTRRSLDFSFSTREGVITPPPPLQMGPWHFVEDPVQWTGPAVPLRAPEESTEPFMTEKAKTNFNGLNLLPWEGAQVVGPEMARIIDVGLVELAVDENKNRPDTKHLPDQNTLHHMRRAVADVLQTPLFSFALFLFEGCETDQAEACDRFLFRLLKGCGGVVYCSITETGQKAYEKCTDSKLTGAALFLRCFLVRFAKRFPQQHGFIHPIIDSEMQRQKLIDTLHDGFQSWSFMEATTSVPAAIVVRMTNDGVRSLVKAPQPHSWIAVNHFYEFCITQPSRELSGHPSIFIIDLGKLSMFLYTKQNITAIAGQLIAAMFHPEPFSAFVVAHAPSVFQFVWGIAKFFLTESARQKFVILNGSASSHFHKQLKVPLDEIPMAVGGTMDINLITAPELLRLKTQENAIAAYKAKYGPDISKHLPSSFLESKPLAGSELFVLDSEPGTPTGDGGDKSSSPGWGRNGEMLGSGGSPGTTTSPYSHDKLKNSRKGSALGDKAKKPTKKDLQYKISSLAGKLEKAGVVSQAHEAAKQAAVDKLRDMKRQLAKMVLWQVVTALVLLAAMCGVAWYVLVTEWNA